MKMIERTIYLSKHDLEGLLQGMKQQVSRIVEVDYPKTMQIHVERSD